MRERWPNTTLFIFAAIGSAVGLGNIWRFPYLVGKYGGGAFLFPYIFALLVIGFPLLVLEFSLGQFLQKGAVDAWRHIRRSFAGIGIASLFGSFGVSCYYGVIMSWCLIYTIVAFWVPWAADSSSFFFTDILRVSNDPEVIQGFSVPVVLGLIGVWVLVYFCLWKGVKGVSNVVAITMPLPIILLLILLGKVIFLPGAWEGLAYFLTPKYEALFDLEVWMAAVTQIFFTMTLGLGVMITYASYQGRRSNIIVNALIIAIADVTISLTAGLVIFATIGNMNYQGLGEINDLAASGPGLAFVVLPEALSTLPLPGLFSFLFFIMLITLGIDSLFSLVEAVATLFYDTFPHASKKVVVFYVCFGCFMGGLVFATSAGIYYLDITDHFVTHYVILLVGFLEVLAIGWVYGPEKMRHQLEKVSSLRLGCLWDWSIKYIIPLALFLILAQSLHRDIMTPYETYPQWALAAFGWGIVGVMIVCSSAYALFARREEV